MDNGRDGEAEKLPQSLNQAGENILIEGLDTSSMGFPCGILRCTYEKHPKAIYANDWMFHFLGIDANSDTWKEFIQQNIFFMVPFGEREKLKRDLELAAESITPISVEHCVRNGNGKKTNLIGWIQLLQTACGEREYVFLYIQVWKKYLGVREEREKAYKTALEAAYDAIFRIEWQEKVLECSYSKSNTHTMNVQGMRVILNSVTLKRLCEVICERDRERVKTFFKARRAKQQAGTMDECDNHIEFRIEKDHDEKELLLVIVDLDEQTTMLCCREITQKKYVERINEEAASIQAIEMDIDHNVGRQPIKSTIYRVRGDRIYLESGVDQNVPEFGLTYREFLHRSKISEKEYQTVIQGGKAILAEGDADLGGMRIMYTTHRNALDPCQEYLLLLHTFKMGQPVASGTKPRVRIHAFGYFDVFVDGKPIIFRYEKSKEMLAILVDRNGSFVANPYFISCLWGDEPYSEKIQGRCRQTAYRLMKTLKQYGIDDIIETVDGHRRIIPEMVECDYFNYINGKGAPEQSFCGAYMSDYSWGEETLSRLLKKISK